LPEHLKKGFGLFKKRFGVFIKTSHCLNEYAETFFSAPAITKFIKQAPAPLQKPENFTYVCV